MPVGFVVVLLLLGVICLVSAWPHTRAPTRRLVQNDAGGRSGGDCRDRRIPHRFPAPGSAGESRRGVWLRRK
jgi:hypothetical protein